MSSYYNIVRGNLETGKIALSSDINHIQLHICDMISNEINDQYDNESFMLGSGEKHKNDFLLTPASKFEGRYVDDRIVFEEDPNSYININRNSVRQVLTLTKSSVYSIITSLKNDSNRDIPVRFELQQLDGECIKATTLTIPAETKEPKKFEVIFDLDFYPVPLNLEHQDLETRDGRDIPDRNPDEESYDEGFVHDINEENSLSQFSSGTSQLYFVIKKTDLNETDLNSTEEDPANFNPETSLGVFYTKSSPNAEKGIYCQVASDNIFSINPNELCNIYFKEVYANGMTYTCKGGAAIINGEKVLCSDSHVSIAGSNSYGNMLTSVYMDKNGHLKTSNYKASLATDVNDFEEDITNPEDPFNFPVALIFTYSSIYGVDREPIVIQSQEYGQLPLNHHERLRRVEKYIKWVDEVAIPAGLKYNLTGTDMFETEGIGPGTYKFGKADSEDKEESSYYITTDSHGNPTIRLSEVDVTTIPITLKETFKDKDGNKISLKENDILNASYLAEIKNMVHDSKNGTLTLSKKSSEINDSKVALNSKEAKITKYNPWDDSKANRPADAKFKKHEREFTIYSGKNGKHDNNSEFPAMTFYTDTNYKMTKLNIPIRKFKNCSGIKFYIWERQSPNNKKNTVWLKTKKYTSKVFSLAKAKVKGSYQYMDNGFTISFGKGGLSLPKGQYVIVCLPIPKSGEGSCYVETYEPKNPKDFLIRYYGAANASHFNLKTRYPEIWYNSATAEVAEEDYQKTGSVVSKEITWTEEGLKNIESIKPMVKGQIKSPDKCGYKIYADTGGGWQKLTPDQDNTMTGGATSFKWKIEFTGNGKDTPTLKYDSEKKYAIEFIITRAKGNSTNTAALAEKDNNMCLTTVPFDGDEILKEYLGDPNFGTGKSRFDQYEFARIWAEPDSNKKMLIDIQGSDKNFSNSDGSVTYPLWSLHYCDLTLDDFSQTNVDYSNYDEEIEYDENNLRLKLDSKHSYNDNDIALTSLSTFKKVPNDIDSTESSEMIFVNNENVSKNQIFLKNVFDLPKDLTKYTGLVFKFKMKASDTNSLQGLGIYISSQTDSYPTRLTDIDYAEELEDTNILPATIDPDVSSASYYDGEIIKIIHYVDKDGDGNKAYEEGYYKYIPVYDDKLGKIIYVLQQVHDLKEYKIYHIGNLTYDKEQEIIDTVVKEESDTSETETTETESTEEDEETPEAYVNITVRIELDPESQVLKTVREIGIVSLNDDTDESFKYKLTGSKMELELKEVKALSEDYYPIFNPERDSGLWKNDSTHCTCYDYNKITLNKTTYNDELSSSSAIAKSLEEMSSKGTNPYTEQICIDYQNLEEKETLLCYMNNKYDGGLSNYKHVGIQLASDVYIPKDCIKIQLCASENGLDPIVSVNVPTLNTIYDPQNSDEANREINLSQIFKKIDSKEKIKSINIIGTQYLKKFMGDIIDTAKGGHINLFVGKIVLYKAETIPMFHQKMRFKLYSSTDGKIDHTSQNVVRDSINVRKIGTIVNYN